MTSSADKCGLTGCDEKEEVSPRGIGILVLSPLLEPLYVNHRAVMLLRELAGMLPETLHPTGHLAVLPLILVDLQGKSLALFAKMAHLPMSIPKCVV